MTLNIPHLKLKAIFIIHFILSVWGAQGFWSPASYTYYNLVFLALLIWSIHQRESEEPIFMALVVDAVSVPLDVLTMVIYFRGHNEASEQFSVTMAAFNLVARFVSTFVLHRIFQERNGNLADLGLGGGLGDILSGSSRSPYEDIDHVTVAHVVPNNDLGDGSPSHFYATGGEKNGPPPYQN